MRHNFRRLDIWKAGIEIAKESYATTRIFPQEERYGLSSQMQRCGVSISSNIAEGTSRKSDKHFITYLENSLGSAYEWETQLIIAYEIEYISEDTFKHLELKIQNIQGKITRFINKLENSLKS